MTKVLIIVAHPDDAELAVGGTIAMLTQRGVEVIVATATVCEPNAEIRHKRIQAAQDAARLLGHQLHWFEDARYDHVEDIPQHRLVQLIDQLVEETAPTAVITHWDGDSHFDHVRLSNAVTASSRRWLDVHLYQFGPNEFRTIRALEFVPTLFLPIADYLEKKLKALSMFEYEGQGFRKLCNETVTRNALLCGARVGVEAAEGLRVVRHFAGGSSANSALSDVFG